MFIQYNENPCNVRDDDCAVRALATLLKEDWDLIYVQLCVLGYDSCRMPNSKPVVSDFLHGRGYKRYVCEDTYPRCQTVEDFCNAHPDGDYLLATNSHVVAVIDGGNWVDTWNSGQEEIVYYWKKGV